eukprot:scaffold91_cov203-Alexandrium_tamarense.AAC.3
MDRGKEIQMVHQLLRSSESQNTLPGTHPKIDGLWLTLMTASRFVTGIKNDGITRSPSAQTRSMPPHLATVATSHSSSHYPQHPVELESSMIYLYVYCTATATLLRVVSEFIRKEGIQGDLQGGRRKSLLNSC